MAFKKGNKFARAMSMTKGKSCNRKAMLRAVAAGQSIESAVAANCSGKSGGKTRRSRSKA